MERRAVQQAAWCLLPLESSWVLRGTWLPWEQLCLSEAGLVRVWQGEGGGVADRVTEAAPASQGHRVLGISGSFDDSSHSDPEACATLGGRYLCLSLWVCRNSLVYEGPLHPRKTVTN